MFKLLRSLLRHERNTYFGIKELLQYIGPGLLVTVGFVDPGNWAANLAAGADHGYLLLWMVTLSTIMLILLQHNVAHLGIVTGLCLSEAATLYLPRFWSRWVLASGMLASISTSFAEILGGAIALRLLFHIPIRLGAFFVLVVVLVMLFTNGYKRIERWIVTFVSFIGLSFIYELALVHVDWVQAGRAWVVPSVPPGSMLVVMSVLGAVVMPHNLFLHSEVIQSRQWHLESESMIQRQLKYEFLDTLFSMLIGWAINSAMILLAATTFYRVRTSVTALEQSARLLEPLLGGNAVVIFAVALLFSGVASSITSGMAAGSIFAGMYSEPYNIRDNHSRLGVGLSLVLGYVAILFVKDLFQGLLASQMVLSIQLPVTIFLQLHLTSSERVMGKYKNGQGTKLLLYIVAVLVTGFNLALFVSSVV